MANEQTAGSTSLLSRNVSIEGDIEGNENIKIEGTVKGKIKLKGDVLVGMSGVIEAEVEATNVIVQGKIMGNVQAQQKLELHSTGKLIGDVSARSIDIKEGAVFEGRSHMITTAAPASSPPPAPANNNPPKTLSKR